MIKSGKLFGILLLFISSNLFSQIDYSLNGYVQFLQTTHIQNIDNNWNSLSSIKNRINFNLYPTNNFDLYIGLRNTLNYGNIINSNPNSAQQFSRDNGVIDLSKNIADGNYYVLNTNIDRLRLRYTISDFEISLGRQRINWGINTVWNPNDIFNTFSYFDFDYIEKPGSDALLIQYYSDYTSSFQLAAKINSDDKITSALMYKLNKFGYDFQILSGILDVDDFIFGAGWAGSIYTAGFNGEFTYLSERKNIFNKNIYLFSTGLNYTFSNSLFVQTSFLYNSNGKTKNVKANNIFSSSEINIKTLSPSRYSIFLKLSKPITPLLKADISTMLNPIDGSLFFNPSLEYSISNEFYVLLLAQIFSGKSDSEFGGIGKVFFLRFKLNF